jgi:outer membrane protein assembly factor BamB
MTRKNDVNGQDDNGFDRIWPRVSAEIESERRKAARRRQAVRRTAAGLGVLGAVGFMFLAVAKIWLPAPDDVGASDSWQVADVSPTADHRSEYPLVRDRGVFAVRRDGGRQHVVCIEKLTGNVLWKSGLSFQECRLAADERRVYVLARMSAAEWLCAALEAQSGKTVWSRDDPRATPQAPSTLTVMPSGVCWTRKGELVLQDCETGDLNWSASVGANETLSAPVEHNGTVFAASRSKLYALSSGTGDRLWHRTLANDSAVFAPLTPFLKTAAGKLLVASRHAAGGGLLQCVDPDTKDVLWTRETPAPINLHADADRVYLRSEALAAYDVRTGSVLWKAKVGGCGPVAFQDGRVYLADPKGRYGLLALDARSGKPVWRHSTVASCGGIVINGETGFVSGSDGRLHAVVLGAERKGRGRGYLSL